MKITSVAKEVEALQMQMSSIEEKLDFLIRCFQVELPSIAETWMRREMERRIGEHPEVLEKLGAEKLKALKSKANDLIASLPEIVKKETSDERDWPHHRETEFSGREFDKNEPFFNRAFRNVISYLGIVLDEFGLLSQLKICVPSWERVGNGGCIPPWERLGNGRFRYAIDPGFEAISPLSVKEFNELYNRYKTLSVKLSNKQKELAKAKAREIWEVA